MKTELSETLQRSLGWQSTVRVIFLEQIPATPAGKVQSVVSDVKGIRHEEA
jgi:hypothetical protein